MDVTSIDTWDKITSFVGFIITIVTLVVAETARRAIKRVQRAITFDKRIPQHLTEIDKMLKDFNMLLNNQVQNVNEINALLGLMASELSNLKDKINNKDVEKLINEARFQIKEIRRLSYASSQKQSFVTKLTSMFRSQSSSISSLMTMNYIQLGEIYTAVDNIRKDNKTQIRG